MLYVSQAPLEKIRPFQERMGWTFPWVSTSAGDFNFDFGISRTEEQTREALAPMLAAGTPPVVSHLAAASGTDPLGYLTETPGCSAFVREDGDTYHVYSTTARGLEFLMGYYPILDRAPKGRDEGDGSQTWIRHHDEY